MGVAWRSFFGWGWGCGGSQYWCVFDFWFVGLGFYIVWVVSRGREVGDWKEK